jgi:hypothetical protein
VKKIAVGDLGEFWYGDYKEPFVQLEGAVPDYPQGVVLIEPATLKLLCAYCGKSKDNLGTHAKVHGMTAREYKESVGLLGKSSLVSEKTRQKMVAHSLRRAARGELSSGFVQWQGKANGGRRARGKANGRWRPEHLNKSGRCFAQVIATIVSLMVEHGRVTTTHLHKKGIGKPTLDAYGGLPRLIELAGARGTGYRNWTDAELLQALRDLDKDLGYAPGMSDMARFGMPGVGTYVRHFGSWSRALLRAGLTPRVPIPVDGEEEIAILSRYSREGSVDRVSQSLNRAESTVSAVLHRYGVPLLHGRWNGRDRKEAMQWAATVARRLAGMPDEVAA